MARPRLSFPFPTGITANGTLVEVLNTVTWPTSRLVAYMRRPSGVTTTPLALLGNGAVAITELFAVLTSVIPPPPLLTYTIAGGAGKLPASWAAAGVGAPNQVTRVISSERTSQSRTSLLSSPGACRRTFCSSFIRGFLSLNPIGDRTDGSG